jgi:hypothetical protein
MDNSKPETSINLDAPVHARELSEAEFHEALTDIRGKLRWRRRVVPTIGEVLRAREAAKGEK